MLRNKTAWEDLYPMDSVVDRESTDAHNEMKSGRRLIAVRITAGHHSNSRSARIFSYEV